MLVSTKPKINVLKACTAYTAIISGLLIFVGCLNVVNWTYNVTAVTKISIPWLSVSISTATCFVISGIALWFLRKKHAGLDKKIIPISCAVLLFVLSAGELIQHVSVIANTDDSFKWFYSQATDSLLMSPLTAVNFILIALSIVFASMHYRKKYFVLANGLVFLYSLFIVICYLYEVNVEYFYSFMQMSSAILFVLLSAGLFLLNPQKGFMRIVLENNLGGSSLRRLLPCIIILVILLGYFLYSDRKEYHYGFHVPLTIIGFIIVLMVIEWMNASLLDKQSNKLIKSRARLTLALASAGDGVWNWDVNRNVITGDKQIEKLFCVAPGSFDGNFDSFLELIHVHDRERVCQELKRVQDEFADLQTTFRVLCPDKSIRYVDLKGKVYRNVDGIPLFMTGICSDLTEQRLAEEKMLQSKQTAEDLSQRKNAFMAGMSHELRSPLNAIIGFSELMYYGKAGPISPNHKEYLGDILTSANQLLLLVNDMLDLTKVETGKMLFHPEEVKLENLLSETKMMFQTIIASKEIQFVIDLNYSLKYVVVDPLRLKQIIYNFVSNAMKCTPHHGRVTVRVMPEDQYMFRLAVEDTGIGIAEEDIPKLFAEFQQLGNSPKQYQGWGLGLTLTKQIVEAQGGKVGVTSVLGQGSTFFAILPKVGAKIEC